MSLLKEINDSLKSREIDPVAEAIKVVDKEKGPCNKYFSQNRMEDFASAIYEEMKNGSSYEDAKANVFDETHMPPRGSECCKALKARVDKLLQGSIKESKETNSKTDGKKYMV